MNRLLTADITYHTALHRFQEAKLLQHLTSMREAILFGVFMDLQKVYGALDQERFLELLVAYRVGLRMLQIFRTYWDQLTMVPKAGRYFGSPFKGYRGVTQDNSLSPMIFNVVVDSVVRHWMTVVMPTEAGVGGLGLTIIDLEAYLYSDDGIVASTQMERLKRVFDILTCLFGQVGLRKNTVNTVVVVCQPCHAPGGMS